MYASAHRGADLYERENSQLHMSHVETSSRNRFLMRRSPLCHVGWEGDAFLLCSALKRPRYDVRGLSEHLKSVQP